jgi:hypothetical protein
MRIRKRRILTGQELMRVAEFDLGKPNGISRPSPGICIYCFSASSDLRDEHVIPYALAANTLILKKSCCGNCQNIIQPYEQEVLKKQLGNFRAQIDAPTRNPKSRQTSVKYNFSEIDTTGLIIRDLGSRSLPLVNAPMVLNLWSSPQPNYGLPPAQSDNGIGVPWTFRDEVVLQQLCRKVAEETGAKNVGLKLGEVNREHYLRFLAKVAHAYAAAELGPDGFEPFLLDVILKRSNDLGLYVGDSLGKSPFGENPAHTLQISLGESEGGPPKGCLVVRIQLYPMFNSPSHIIIVGRVTPLTQDRLVELRCHPT